jgi:hypothetical protein
MPAGPLALSNSELDIVMAAARPLDVDRRDEFLQAVAGALARHGGEIGPGVVYAVCREQQRRFFDAPDLSNHKGAPVLHRISKRHTIEV